LAVLLARFLQTLSRFRLAKYCEFEHMQNHAYA